MNIFYEPHPVSPERKAELRAQGFKIMDAIFQPAKEEKAPTRRKKSEQVEDGMKPSEE